jgi:hypothetical protein
MRGRVTTAVPMTGMVNPMKMILMIDGNGKITG